MNDNVMKLKRRPKSAESDFAYVIAWTRLHNHADRSSGYPTRAPSIHPFLKMSWANELSIPSSQSEAVDQLICIRRLHPNLPPSGEFELLSFPEQKTGAADDLHSTSAHSRDATAARAIIKGKRT
jgi:hypothetical protein